MRMRHALAMTLNSLVHISEKEEREASRLLRPAVKLWPSDSHSTNLFCHLPVRWLGITQALAKVGTSLLITLKLNKPLWENQIAISPMCEKPLSVQFLKVAPSQPHLPLLPVRWLEITRALAKGWYLLVDNAVGVRLLFHPCVNRHYQSDFWRSCAPPKSCLNWKSFWDPSKQVPNTTETSWFFWFKKKHVLAGQPNVHT